MSVVAMESQCMKTIMIPLLSGLLQIFAVISAELAKSEECDFSCIELALKKISASCKYKSSQEINTILC